MAGSSQAWPDPTAPHGRRGRFWGWRRWAVLVRWSLAARNRVGFSDGAPGWHAASTWAVFSAPAWHCANGQMAWSGWLGPWPPPGSVTQPLFSREDDGGATSSLQR